MSWQCCVRIFVVSDSERHKYANATQYQPLGQGECVCLLLYYMLLSVSVSAPTSSCPIHSSFHSRHVLLFLFIFILHSTLQLYTMFHFPHNPYFIVHTTYFVASVCLIHSTLQFILISLTCSLNQHFLCVIHYVLPPH